MSPDNNHLHNKLNNYFLNNGLNLLQSNSMTGIFLACISSALPVYLFINGINYSDNLWFGLFIFEFLLYFCLIWSATPESAFYKKEHVQLNPSSPCALPRVVEKRHHYRASLVPSTRGQTQLLVFLKLICWYFLLRFFD